MITLRASPASTASTEPSHPTKSLLSGSQAENARALPVLSPPTNPLHEVKRREVVRPVLRATVNSIRQAVRRRRAPSLAALAAATARAQSEVFHIADVCLGAISEGRSRASDAGTVGYFVSPVAVPLTEIQDRGSADLLDHAASQALAALKHARTPFDELVRSLRPPATGLAGRRAAYSLPHPFRWL